MGKLFYFFFFKYSKIQFHFFPPKIRFVSLPEKIDQPIVQPTPKTSSLGFFRKRNKNTQQQQQQQHKENNGIDATAIDLLAAANKSTIIGGDGLPTNTIANCTISGPTAADKQAAVSKMALDFFADDFEGVTVSSTKCLSCETITEQQETMIDLSVPITGYENMETIDNAQLFIQVNVVFFFLSIFYLSFIN